MEKKSEPKYRNYVFTSYQVNPPEYDDNNMSYLIYQQEKCPTTGNLHWQGYVEFKGQKRRSECQKCLQSEKNDNNKYTMFVERRMGNQKQAVDYCTKSPTSIEGTRKQFGNLKDQGHRSELDSLFEAIESGLTGTEILLQFGGKALKHIHAIKEAQRTIWGKCPLEEHIINKKKQVALQIEMMEQQRKQDCDPDFVAFMNKPTNLV